MVWVKERARAASWAFQANINSPYPQANTYFLPHFLSPLEALISQPPSHAPPLSWTEVVQWPHPDETCQRRQYLPQLTLPSCTGIIPALSAFTSNWALK